MAQHTIQNTPVSAKRAIILSLVQVIAGIIAFMNDTFESAALVMLFALIGTAALVVTGIMWGTSPTARRAMRLVFAVPVAVASVGVVCAVATEVGNLSVTHALNLSMSGADTPFWYTLLFDAAVTMTYGHTLLMFLFPAMIAAAAFGEQKDLRYLRAASVSHVVAMILSVFVFAQQVHIPAWNDMSEHVPTWECGDMEITLVQLVMLAVTVGYAALAWFVRSETKKEPSDKDGSL